MSSIAAWADKPFRLSSGSPAAVVPGCGLVAHRAISSGPVAPRARTVMSQGATGPERRWPTGRRNHWRGGKKHLPFRMKEIFFPHGRGAYLVVRSGRTDVVG